MNRRLMLGSPDEVTVQRVSSVAEELGDELVHVCTTSHEVTDAVAGFRPDVLIVSETLGPIPVLDLIRQTARQDPFVGILLLSSTSDPELFRVAMEAGARSIAPLGFTIDDLGQRIESAASWAGIVRSHIAGDNARMLGSGHVVALAGSKGGVGTSTIALHTALEAAAAGRRTCLVDLDLQSGDVATLLNISHRRDITDLIGSLNSPVGEISGQTLDDVLFRHSSGLNVLLAPREGERGEEITEAVGRAVIGALKSRFDVVVMDVGSVLTPAGACAVEIADRAVLVATPDVLSMRGCRRTAQLWERLRLRPEKDVTVLLNRISRSVEVQPDLAARLARLPISEFGVPASFRSFEAAANTGEPQRLLDRDTRRALARVAESLGVRAPVEAATGGRRAARRRDAGQAAVEFMGLLPVLGILLACLVQGVLIGYSHVLAGHAASTAARVSVSPERGFGDIDARAREELPGAWQEGAQVTLGGGAGGDPRWGDPDAEVTVQVVTPAIIPGLAALFGDALNATATAQMRFEGRLP